MPISKAATLFNQFVELTAGGNVVDEFTIKRLESSAKAEMQHFPVVGHVLLGAVATYRFDRESSIKHHLAALKLEDSSFTNSNYSVSLLLLGEIQEAVNRAVVAMEKTPEDLSLLTTAINISVEAGSIDKLRELCTLYRERTGEVSPFEAGAGEIDLCLAKRGIPHEDFQDAIKIARGFLFERRVRAGATFNETDVASGNESILHVLNLRKPLNEVLALQDDLAIALADGLGERWHPDVVMVEFRQLDEH